MNSIELKARAKINLAIDILRKRPDNYHDVRMIMQTVALHDIIYMEIISSGINIYCSNPEVPEGLENLAYQAAALFADNYGIKKGVSIRIDKNIPVAAGLAGGSTDAAAVLKGMNILFNTGLHEDELILLGKNIGADVPYCIKGGTVLAEGIGDILTELPALPPTNIVLVKPDINISTQWVYNRLNLAKINKRPNIDMIIEQISSRKMDMLAKSMLNVLETVTASEYDEINIIKHRLNELGADGSMMTGSGPTVFAIFKDRERAEEAFEVMKESYKECYLTETICEER